MSETTIEQKRRDLMAETHTTTVVSGVLSCSCGWRHRHALLDSAAIEEQVNKHLDAMWKIKRRHEKIIKTRRNNRH